MQPVINGYGGEVGYMLDDESSAEAVRVQPTLPTPGQAPPASHKHFRLLQFLGIASTVRILWNYHYIFSPLLGCSLTMRGFVLRDSRGGRSFFR